MSRTSSVSRRRSVSSAGSGIMLIVLVATFGCVSMASSEGDEPVEEGNDVEAAAEEEGADEPASEQPDPARRVIAWILSLGPSAPSGPSAFRAYDALVAANCDEVLNIAEELGEPSRSLYRATAQACLAAFEGQTELWEAAHLAAAEAGDGDGSCLDVAVRGLLDSLLEAHEEDPGAEFEAATGGGQALAAPCPTITQLVPESGPPESQVRVIGTNLDVDLQVRMYHGPAAFPDEEVLTPQVVSSTELLVELGSAEGSSAVCIALFVEPNWYADGAVFALEDVADDVADEDEGEEPGGSGASEEPDVSTACPPAP